MVVVNKPMSKQSLVDIERRADQADVECDELIRKVDGIEKLIEEGKKVIISILIYVPIFYPFA